MNSLLNLLYIVTFLVSLILIINGSVMVLKKFIHPGYDIVDATIMNDSCKIRKKDSSCCSGLDKPNMYYGMNCVTIVSGTTGTTGYFSVDNVVVTNKYKNGDSLKLFVDPNNLPQKSEDIRIYNPDSFINGIIQLCIGLLFMFGAYSGLNSSKKTNIYKNIMAQSPKRLKRQDVIEMCYY
jgi:hypothetical protein